MSFRVFVSLIVVTSFRFGVNLFYLLFFRADVAEFYQQCDPGKLGFRVFVFLLSLSLYIYISFVWQFWLEYVTLTIAFDRCIYSIYVCVVVYLCDYLVIICVMGLSLGEDVVVINLGRFMYENGVFLMLLSLISLFSKRII